MRISFQLVIGLLLVLWGVLLLLSRAIGISFWMLCWPSLIILLGLWLLLRPQFSGSIKITPVGDLSRGGVDALHSEEIWMFAGDIELDLRQSQIPAGETCYRLRFFAGEVELRLPPGVGYAIKSSAMVTNAEIEGLKVEYVFSGLEQFSPDYEQAERKIRLDIASFVTDLEVETF